MGNPVDAPPPWPRPRPPLDEEKRNEKFQQRSTPNKTQSFPPPQDLYSDEDEPQKFPPPQHHHKPHPFPPPDYEDDYATPVQAQAFPPPPEEDYHASAPAFPPRPNYTHFQQPNVAPPFRPAQGFAPPVHGNVQMGHPAVQSSPYNQTASAATPTGWKSDLFDCMKDPQNALITAFFPCVTFGQIAEIVDSGHTSCGSSGMMYGLIAVCIAMPCIMSCSYRTKLRSQFVLTESPAPDWVVHCCCECCALCQEYRELKERGYDPSIGWMGNQAAKQQQQQFPMAAPMGQRMI